MGYRKDITKQRAFQRAWMNKRRDAFLRDKKCAVCGVTKNLIVTRVKGNRKKAMWSWSAKTLAKMTNECRVLCKPHQLDELAKRKKIGKYNVNHGTNNMYTRHKCRCKPCRAAHNKANKKYKVLSPKTKKKKLAQAKEQLEALKKDPRYAALFKALAR